MKRDYNILNIIKTVQTALTVNGTENGMLRLGTLSRANFVEAFRKDLVIESLTNSVVKVVENKKRKVKEYSIKVHGKKLYTVYADEYETWLREHNALSNPTLNLELFTAQDLDYMLDFDESVRPYVLTGMLINRGTGEVLEIKEVNYNDDQDLEIQKQNLRNYFNPMIN